MGIWEVWNLPGTPVPLCTVHTLDVTLDGLGKSGINPPKLLLEQMWKLRPKETQELIVVYFGRGILQQDGFPDGLRNLSTIISM